MTIDVYFVGMSPPCQAVILTAKILGIKLNKKTIDLETGEQLRPEYLKINPLHTVPTIHDDGFYLWESRAILTYLVNKYAPENPLYPKCPKARAVIDRMMYFDIGTLYKAEADYLYPPLFEGKPVDASAAEAFQKALAFLEDFLSKTPYAAGDHLTLADLSIVCSLSIAMLMDYDYSTFPKITAWMTKLKTEIPNFKEIVDEPLIQYKAFMQKT